MILQEIGRLVNAAASHTSKLSLDQVDHFLTMIGSDIDLAEHVLDIIQKSHGIGLEAPPEPDNSPAAQSE